MEKKGGKKLSRKQRDLLRQRYELFRAAEKVFAQKGFHKTTMTDIAKEAEFSVGFIYKIFKSKEELYADLMLRKLEEMDKAIDVRLEKAGNPYAQIETIIESVMEHLKDNRDFFKIYLNEADGFDWNIERKFGKKISDKFDGFIAETTEIFDDGIKKGFFEKLDPLALSISFVGMLNGYCSYWTRYPNERDVKSDIEVMKKVFLGNIVLKKS